MWFDCRYSYFPQPYDSELFLRNYTIDIYSGNSQGEVLVGRIGLDYLDLIRVEEAGESVYDVCDCDSAGWEQVYRILFEDREEEVDLKAEFAFDDPVFEIVFLHRFVLHPSLSDWRMFVVSHVAEMFSSNSAMVMWDDAVELTDRQLADVGFRRIAGQELLFRPNMLQHPYRGIGDRRESLDLEVDNSLQDWVLQQWESDE